MRRLERHFKTPAELATSFAAECAERLSIAIDRCGRASIALSGGKTPALLYPALAKADLDWSRITCTLTDERCVPTDHPESNERAIRSYFFATPAEPVKLVGLHSGAATLEQGLSAAEHKLDEVPWPIDVVHLGLGLDGHISSLFPNDAPIESAQGRLVASPATPVHGPRISLSLPALVQAGTVFLVFTGSEKLTLYQAARTGRLKPTHPLHQLLRSSANIETYASP